MTHNSNTDWLDALSALRGTMSAGAEEPVQSSVDAAPEAPAQKQRLDIILDRKGRGGKTATIIAGFTVDDGHVAELAAYLKKQLGTGGSARGGEILVQGDRRDDVLKLLTKKGYKARII